MANPLPTAPPSYKGWLTAVGFAYLVFVIYGSLVPLKFTPLSLPAAIDKFRAIPYLELGMASRADWVANLLLFIPLAFLWCGVLWPKKGVWLRTVSAGIVILACGGLSIAIEFVQVFFPQRTVSLNDIYAEFLGGCIGVALWCFAGRSATKWLQATGLIRGTTGIAQRLLAAYLFAMFGYSLLPLDLTLSPVEIYHKWSAGKVVLLPFGADYASPAQFAYDICSDIALWIPVAFLWRWAYRTPALSTWLLTTAAAAVLEFLQLFVYSRITDLTDVITAAAGGALGAWLFRVWVKSNDKSRDDPGRGSPQSHSWRWLAATIAWLAILAMVFWYPFDFKFERDFISSQLAGMTKKVPLEAYYFGTEFRAITEVLHKTSFMMPLGYLLVKLAGAIGDRASQTIVRSLPIVGVVAVATLIEAGQVLLPSKGADVTDWLLEIAGGWMGIVAFRYISTGLAPPTTQNAQRPRSRGMALRAAVTILVAGTAIWVATRLPQTPYNLRNLPHPDYPYLSILLVTAALIWLAGFPSWIAGYLGRNPKATLRYPGILILYGLIVWALTVFAVEPMRAHKFVGSNLDWPWQFESLLRTLALTAGVGNFVVLGFVLGGAGRHPARALAIWIMHATWLLPLTYWAVIAEAATDNLVELLAWGAGPGAALLAMLIPTCIAFTATRLVRALATGSRSGIAAAIVIAAISFPLCYILLSAATEPMLYKYGKLFSGMQFILSSDRAHYAEGNELVLRYAVLHACLLTIAMVGLVLFRKRVSDHTVGVKHSTPAMANGDACDEAGVTSAIALSGSNSASLPR